MLHDAFFKHQTKPPLTSPGDLYYEGKEFEAKNQEHKPGHVSAELREVRSFCRTITRCWGVIIVCFLFLFFVLEVELRLPLYRVLGVDVGVGVRVGV